MRILIIEDEPTLGDVLESSLEAEAYAVDLEVDGKQGFYRAQTNDYDAILLNDILPSKHGYEICKELRASGKTVPILLMSTQSEIDWKVSVLNDGADDYLTKPFSLAEMSARLRALLRRPQGLAHNKLCAGGLVLDEASADVSRDGRQIYLTTKEFSLLHYLMRNADHLVSRAMIFEHVWNAEIDPLSNMIETHVYNLRRKIDRPEMEKLIHTISGRGYIIQSRRKDASL